MIFGIEKVKFFNIIRSKKVLILELGQSIKYHIRKILIEKYTENVYQRLFPDLYLVLINSPKYSPCIQETVL